MIVTNPHPDILILDIIFRDKSEGLQLLKDIANAEDGVMSKLKVVVLTADSYLPDLKVIKEIVDRNAHRMRFYQKMVRAMRLAEEIKKWLNTTREEI